MLNVFEFDTVPEMHDSMCRTFFTGKLGQDFDWIGSPEVGMSNVTIGVKSFDYNHDFKLDFQRASRWGIMVKQYVNPEALDATLAMVEQHLAKRPGVKSRINQKRGIATLRLQMPDDWEPDLDDDYEAGQQLQTNLVGSRKTGTRTSRRWGSCMLSMTYRIAPRPTVTLNSRTTYFGMLAMMDVTVANVFGRMCNQLTGFDMAETEFVWQINLAQWHGFRSLAWALTDEAALKRLRAYVDRRDEFKNSRQGLYRSITGFRRLTRLDDEGVKYGDEKFASALRMRKRYHSEILGPKHARRFAGGKLHPEWGEPFPALPHLWSSDLDFSPIGRPLDYSE